MRSIAEPIIVRTTFLSLSALLAPILSLEGGAQDLSSTAPQGSESGPALGIALAEPVSDAPVVDGRLDDAAWQTAPALTDFVQRIPWDGQPASERTEVRVLYDTDALYVGVWAFDREPGSIVPGERIRDYEVEESDAVVLIFDTFRDEQNGFVFGTTPAGIEYDGQVANEGEGGGRFLGGGGGANRRRFQEGSGAGFNKNWDGSWTVATEVDGRGWYAEFRIPFNTLRYGDDNESWGFNVARRIRRRNEESFWAAVPREFNLYRLNYAGELKGLQPPFRRLATVTPYVLGSTARNYEVGQTSFAEDAEVGGEAKIQVTQGLTLDVTVNTDFAQVEVDDQQVNLTRFSLLFPEKRPFFLENAGFFTVGAGGADLFFSRRIGIAEGQQVPIKGGARLSGKAAGFNVGLLHIQTDGLEELQPANAYSVARVARELPNRSRIGALFVGRDGDPGDYNRTYAVDGRFGIGEALTLNSFVARTETPGLGGDEHAFDVQAGWSSRNWSANLNAREVGENFNPEVGFLPRAGYRYYQVYGQRFIRPRKWLREIRPHFSFFTYRSRKSDVERGFEETSRLHVDSHFEWPDGMEFSPAMNWVREGLYEEFEVPGTDVVVQPGTYEGWEAAWRFNTNRSARVVFDGSINWGSFLSGSRKGQSATVTLRQGSALSTSVRVEYNDVNLEEGSFQTTLAGVNVAYFFTPSVYLQSLVQYSDQIDRWSANVRFGWLTTAGTGLFIVYNDVQGVDQLSGPLGRSLIVKFTRQFTVLGG